MGVVINGLKDGQQTVKAPGGKVYFMQKTIKGDTFLVLADSAMEMEDEYKNLYFTTEDSSKTLIEPPYQPKVLMRLVSHNNILNQCIEAMEVNIDGTGFEFVPKEEGATPNEAEIRILKSFFNEPYPGVSFLNMRRKLRRDMESCGYGYLEVLRSIDGQIAALRNVNAHMVRLVRLDKAVPVTRTLERNGEESKITLIERERRYVIRINNSNVYFKEYGSTRRLHKLTGEWEGTNDKGTNTQITAENDATELLMFQVHKDVGTAYSVPRWINQMPSVVGSRKAEESNLEFFDAGGVPPAIIFIQGGTLAKDMADQLKMYLSGASKSNNRAVVVEAQSSSGTLESAGQVQVKVERFGAEKAQDSMFAKYDELAAEHVRTGFRLPPLFLGKAVDYNFATAKTAYMIAEAQVFEPERREFDEIINKTLLRGLGVKDTIMKSHPITLKDVEQQLKAMEVVRDKVKAEGLVSEVNKIGGLTLEYDEEAAQREQENKEREFELRANPAQMLPVQRSNQPNPSRNQPQRESGNNVADLTAERNRRQVAKASDILSLARRYAEASGVLVQKAEITDEDRELVMKQVDELSEEENDLFMQALSGLAAGKHDATLGTLLAHDCSTH